MSTQGGGNNPGGTNTTTTEGSGAVNSEVYELIVQSIAKQQELFKVEKERLELLEKSGEVKQKQLDLAQSELNIFLAQKDEIAEQVRSQKELLTRFAKLENVAKKRKEEMAEALEKQLKAIRTAEQEVTLAQIKQQTIEAVAEKEKEIAKIKKEQQAFEDEVAAGLHDQNEALIHTQYLREGLADAEKELLEAKKDLSDEQDNLNEKEEFLIKKRKEFAKALGEQLEKTKGAYQDLARIQGKLNNLSGKFVSKFGMAADVGDTMLGQGILLKKEYEKAAEEFEKLTNAEKAEAGSPMSMALKNSLNLTNVLASIVDQIVKIALETEKVAKNLMKTTAISKSFEDELANIFQQSAAFGMTMEDTGKNFNALRENFSAFDQTNSSLNESLGLTVQTLAGLSVDAAKTTKHMDMLHKAFGVSELDAAKLTVELASMGDQMSISADKMVSDFASISSNLAIYGKRSMDVFKGLTAAAKATGIEVGTLVKMAEQFDTFDKAAGAAAKLNAALGTQLSTIDMMNMDHDERINYLRQEVQIATGGNIDDMDKFSQLFIADAMGVEVEHMRRLVNMSEGDYADYLDQQEQSRKTQAEMAKLAEKALPMFEQLQLAVTKVAVAFSPFIIFISKLLIGITDINQEMNGMFLPILGQLGIALALLTGKLVGLNASLGVIGIVIFTLAAIIDVANREGFPNFAIALEFITAGTMAFGIALKFSLGHLGIFLSIFAALATVFAIRINPQLINAFAHMAVGVTALGFALQFLGPKAMLGAVALMGLFMAFAYFFSGLADSGENMNSIVTGMALLGIAMAGIGYMFANPLLIAGAAVFTAMMIGLGVAVMMMGSGFEKMVNSLRAVKDIMKDIDGLSSQTFVAISAEGSRTSAFIGSKDVIESINKGTIDVNVNIPKFDMPKPVVNVYIDGSQITSGIYSTVGGAG